MDNVLVSIRCMTYNHAPYIRNCLNGIVMQKTNFRFEAIVHDDASTDGTAAIVKEYADKYPEIIKPIFQVENQYSKRNGSVRRAVDAAMSLDSRYIAVCEGDDYWIDPYKLQKQVDFLEANPEYGLVHTDFHFVDVQNNLLPVPNTPLYRNMKGRIFNGYLWDYFLINPGFILTCTICYRRALLDDKEVRYYDHGLFLMLARKSKIYYLPEVTSAYRRNPKSIMMSMPQAVSNRMGLTLLYQLYYYYTKPTACADYYKKSFKAHVRMLECYANILLRFKKNVFKEYKKLLYLISKNPLFLLVLPFFAVAVVIRKRVRIC